MFNRWSLGRKLGAGFAIAGAILLAVALVGYRSISTLIENDDLVNRSHLVQIGFADLVSDMKDAETGQRGFVITGDPAYLEPYQASLGSIAKRLDALRTETADNPGQQQHLVALGPLVDRKLAELKTVIDVRRTAGFEAAAKEVGNNVGKDLMDRIRAAVAASDRETNALLAQRAAEAHASADWAIAITLWGSIAGAVLVGLIGWFIVATLTRQIGAAVQHVQSSSSELQAAANQQATGAREQATAMTEIATTIRELLASSRQIAESAQSVSHIAEETASGARAGTGTVDQANDAIGGIRRQVDLVVTHMLDLGKKSQQIGAIVEIVSELAEQTNILAINASIEAAGAGETGRRFAIVADEIRKLADRVGGSAKEIRGLIEEVRGAVNTAVMATEGGSKAVDAGSRHFGDVAASFSRIAGLVTTTTDAAREIELSTKQQSTAVEQVNVAIAGAAQATKEMEASSGQTLETASALADLSRELSWIVRPQAVV
ncbi:MAG TPA: CHASE3 domain-containing protein [Stellaceae bacterium]|nr:CHASE3 domain-containing protein [Stellaceae bacterium]